MGPAGPPKNCAGVWSVANAGYDRQPGVVTLARGASAKFWLRSTTPSVAPACHDTGAWSVHEILATTWHERCSWGVGGWPANCACAWRVLEILGAINPFGGPGVSRDGSPSWRAVEILDTNDNPLGPRWTRCVAALARGAPSKDSGREFGAHGVSRRQPAWSFSVRRQTPDPWSQWGAESSFTARMLKTVSRACSLDAPKMLHASAPCRGVSTERGVVGGQRFEDAPRASTATLREHRVRGQNLSRERWKDSKCPRNSCHGRQPTRRSRGVAELTAQPA